MTVQRPIERIHLLQWLRQNLFSTWYNAILTLLGLWLIISLLTNLLIWVITEAQWQIIGANLKLLLVGRFPVEELWRVWFALACAAALAGLSWAAWPAMVRSVAIAYACGFALLTLLPVAPANRLWLVACALLIIGGRLLGKYIITRETFNLTRIIALGWMILLPMTLWLLHGFGIILPVVETRQWGGLLLTVVMAISGVLFSFPLGVLLAIGRRSELPMIRGFCTIFIEAVRGVPLVTVLFMFLIMLPLFLPGSENTNNVIRAIVGFTIFTSAYIAENVRGGLQAIPRGQEEAARAMGLPPHMIMILIVLPQALRIVIPANVSQFISLFKDTSLVVAAGGGILELLGTSHSILGQPEFLGRQAEVLLFAGMIYWTIAYSLTYVSKRIEAAGRHQAL